jgi:membrane protease YdiL (CAAX protease family)
MSRAARHRIDLIEPLAAFAMIMAYIWQLRYSHHNLWLLILAGIIVSHLLRHEGTQVLGFQRRNLRQCLDEFSPALAFLVLAALGTGILLQTTRHIRFGDAFLAWAGYVPWGTFQQYLLNGYFLNRFAAALPAKAAALTSAALFSGAHTPNWFLMLVTLLTGYICARIYMRHKNLWFLGLAHATIGFLVFLVVPDSVSHHLVVGPGFFTH